MNEQEKYESIRQSAKIHFGNLMMDTNDWEDVTLFDLFLSGFECGYLEAEEKAWEDGYAHGYDSGRYKSIEEGF